MQRIPNGKMNEEKERYVTIMIVPRKEGGRCCVLGTRTNEELGANDAEKGRLRSSMLGLPVTHHLLQDLNHDAALVH